MENKREHLSFIQNIIDRMAHNSLSIKEWNAGLIAGLFAFTVTKEFNDLLVFIASVVIIVMFAILDSFYLSQERKFRILYDFVRQKNESEIDFSMKVDKDFKNKYDGKKPGIIRCIFSPSIYPFYGVLVIVSLILFVFAGK